MNVFRVEDDTNRFVGFRDKRSDLFANRFKEMLNGVSLAKYWTKGPVDVLPGMAGDFVGGPVIFARIAATARVIDLLGKPLASCCELLPFESLGQTYWGLYLPKTSSCLDLDKSPFWSKTPDNSQIRDPVFVENMIPNDLLFRLPGSFHYYATDSLVDLVQKHSLTGLRLRRVWSRSGESTIGTSSSLPEVSRGDLPRVKKRITTKRDRLLKRLWEDAIDSWTTSDRLTEMFSAKSSELPAMTSEGVAAIRKLQGFGVKPSEITHLVRAVAYQVAFDVLIAIEEEGLDRSAALRSLHEDLLTSNPNPWLPANSAVSK
ncbi:hypothetical protein ETAA8_62130 [Anatilimnocola aggregata]|uniref:Uncharacterized protein n=1 Tax=Anatilimnocola aggregata TaxID=2528021 RepID=A0A517YLH6_9BACT|nr:hypothetical protein [Anatilimnocola aggregata]QDU31060.1 hypothetical protein ETAA8_62130 [Anatilimnocola aggregata]